MIKYIQRKIKARKSYEHSLLVSANDFLRDYEKLYTEFWVAPWGEDSHLIGACQEMRKIGKKYFGIAEEAFSFIQFKVEHSDPAQVKPIDII